MVNWYEDIAELIAGFNTEWFPQILQGALQHVFDYDYFLFVLYEKNVKVRIVRSDFRDKAVNKALQYFENETFVADAMFRLITNDQLEPGLHDMRDLCRYAKNLPPVPTKKLTHIVECNEEEMGYRTLGWPKYLQETCIVARLNQQHYATISLYNTGLVGREKNSAERLRLVLPTIISLLEAYFNSPFGKQHFLEGHFEVNDYDEVQIADVGKFFADKYQIKLTPREVEIFAFLLQGNTVFVAADALCISIHTAKTHRRNVYSKIGHGNQLELMNQFNQYMLGR